MKRCPGQDKRFWKPEDIYNIPCPKCGYKIEFWKDELRLKCPGCKEVVSNPKLDLACAQWCQYSKECLSAMQTQADRDMCNKLIEKMEKLLAGKRNEVEHRLKILEFADQIQPAEGGNPLVVRAAAIFYDIARFITDNYENRISGILTEIGIEKEDFQQILQTAEIQTNTKDKTIESEILLDAVCLTELYECQKSGNALNAKGKNFYTKYGAKLADSLFESS